MKLQRRTVLALVAASSSASLIAGCGSSGGGSGSNNSSQSPSAELTNAVTTLGKASTLTTSLKLGATASQISALAAATGSNGLSPAEASAIAGAQVSVEVVAPAGKTLSDLTHDSSGSAADFTVSDNGTTYLTVRSVNKTLYVQADLKDLLTTIGQATTYAQLQNAPGSPPFLTALVDGKWISLPQSAAGSVAGAGGSTYAELRAVVSGIKKIFSQDATVTRISSGSTDQLALSANSRTVVKDFVSTLTSNVPSAAALFGTTDPNNVPSQDIALGAEVTRGALSQLSIDLGQFDPAGKGHLPVDLNFTQGGPQISAPSGAVAVNTQELAQLLSSFAGGLGAGG